ncbi:MAG: hypothetical protein JWM85_3263 [Acidimicrobiaceae bacterium]|nr:hypothetical protein [Acidimicrobiaceae bacterium]
MEQLVDNNLAVERQDIFDVMQVTRDTDLETLVGADLVDVEPGQRSKIHRHNRAETVLYFLDGNAEVVVADEVLAVRAGDRVRIGRGVFHGVRTPAQGCRFLSVQTPPILDKATGVLDLEPLEEPTVP